ncbi:hypothetical protein [Pandoraea pnomenusa]|uniref:hypothetical protein n=1 Tax=Pandoraea pnomenusa TaxID=93220 RepID=UPI001AC98436|nr:hypothetical protein [Pandoraea pnomenusa]MBN9096177.1 hypothetical protein [Pandoraea pnomenusa]
MKSQFTSKKPAAGYPSSVNGSQGTPPSSTPNLESAPPQQTPDQPQFEIPQTAGPNSPNAAKRENVWSRSKPEVNSQPTSPVITSEQQPAEEHAVRQQGAVWKHKKPDDLSQPTSPIVTQPEPPSVQDIPVEPSPPAGLKPSAEPAAPPAESVMATPSPNPSTAATPTTVPSISPPVEQAAPTVSLTGVQTGVPDIDPPALSATPLNTTASVTPLVATPIPTGQYHEAENPSEPRTSHRDDLETGVRDVARSHAVADVQVGDATALNEPPALEQQANSPSGWQLALTIAARGAFDGVYTATGKTFGELAAAGCYMLPENSEVLKWVKNVLCACPAIAGGGLGAIAGASVGKRMDERWRLDNRAFEIVGGSLGLVAGAGIGTLTPVSYALRGMSHTAQLAALVRSIVYPLVRDLLTASTSRALGTVRPPDDFARRAKMTLVATIFYFGFSVGSSAANAELGNVSTSSFERYMREVMSHVGVSAGVELLDTVVGTVIRAMWWVPFVDRLAHQRAQGDPVPFYYREPDVYRPHPDSGSTISRWLRNPFTVSTLFSGVARYFGVNLVQTVPLPEHFDNFLVNLGASAINGATEFRGMSAQWLENSFGELREARPVNARLEPAQPPLDTADLEANDIPLPAHNTEATGTDAPQQPAAH